MLMLFCVKSVGKKMLLYIVGDNMIAQILVLELEDGRIATALLSEVFEEGEFNIERYSIIAMELELEDWVKERMQTVDTLGKLIGVEDDETKH